MEYSDYNWTMEEKGEEIFIFFEMFCISIILLVKVLCKIIDWIEK